MVMMLDNNLAKTFALEEYRKGRRIEASATKARKRAKRRILMRKCLDGMSAIVYALTFKWKSVKSVYKAHSEYNRLTKNISTKGCFCSSGKA